MTAAIIKKPYEPQSRELARVLIHKIHNGEYAPGQRLESIRELAERYGVGRQVVLSAFSLMAKQNYVYTAQGSGTYVNPSLKTGLFYRIGWFINQLTPFGMTVQFAHTYAARRHFNLVLGSNYEENFTLADWLVHKGDLDGVVVSGIVDDGMLKYPRVHRIPYVVVGNYDISPDHPQINYNVYGSYFDAMSELFGEHRWKSFAVIAGTPDMRADREAVEGIRAAAVKSGLTPDQGIFEFSSDDGYPEVISALKHNPDVIIFCGSHWLGLLKYCELHPGFRRPTVVINRNQMQEAPAELYDFSFEPKGLPAEKEIAHRTVDYLIDILNTNGRTSHHG